MTNVNTVIHEPAPLGLITLAIKVRKSTSQRFLPVARLVLARLKTYSTSHPKA
ncbi:MAG: hypothetical protein ACM3XO_21600 [Bacteroidota bacterium]